MRKTAIAVHDAHAFCLQVCEVIERIENAVSQPALPRRRAHPVEQQRILFFRRSCVILVIACVNLLPSHTALIQSLKQRPEPVRMLVVNGNWTLQFVPLFLFSAAHEPSLGCPSALELFQSKAAPVTGSHAL